MGPVVTGADVRFAFQTLLEEWVPSALNEIGERANAARPDAALHIDEIATWSRLPDESIVNMEADQSPMVAVVSAGVVEQPSRDSDGLYRARWRVGVIVVVRGDTYEETSDLVGIYCAAVRVAGAQQRIDLPGARRASWIGESYSELDTDGSRSLGSGRVVFDVDIAEVLDDSAGPAVPPEAPAYEFPVDPEAETAVVATDAL